MCQNLEGAKLVVPDFIASSILAIISGATIALLTHYFSSRRDVASRKARLIGWLRWLTSFFEEVEKKRIGKVDVKGKLPWWADHVQQATGDVFVSLKQKESENLNALIEKAWSDDIWKTETWGTYPNIQAVDYIDYERIKELKELTIKLITELSPKDPSH